MCPFFPARAYPKLFSVPRLTPILFLAFFLSSLSVLHFKSIIGQEHISIRCFVRFYRKFWRRKLPRWVSEFLFLWSKWGSWGSVISKETLCVVDIRITTHPVISLLFKSFFSFSWQIKMELWNVENKVSLLWSSIKIQKYIFELYSLIFLNWFPCWVPYLFW